MIHAKQWHYSLQQRLPVASFHSFYTKKSKGFFRYQFYMQKARRSSIQSTKTYKVFQTFQSFMTFQPYRHLYTFQHLPVHQYLPVLSNVSRDSTRSSISSIRMQILHTDWFPPETPLSTSQRQYKTFYKHYILQRKGDVAISVKR